MATQAMVRRERKQVLESVRRAERVVDSQLELMERELYRLRSRKRLLDAEDSARLGQKYKDFVTAVNVLEKALTNFQIITSI